MRTVILAALVLAFGVFDGRLWAQGSGSSRTSPPSSSGSSRTNPGVPASPRPPTADQFGKSFWNFLTTGKSPFRRWGGPAKSPAKGGPSGASSKALSPHRNDGRTYINEIANRSFRQLPYNAVFVREEYSADGQTVEKIAVMYRSKGADPKSGDWYWLLYEPTGKLMRIKENGALRPVAGHVQNCIDCHRHAAGQDLVFLNDRPAPGMRPAPNAGSGSHR